MTDRLRVLLEIGTKGRRVVAGPTSGRARPVARSWTIQFLIRRTANHAMDHAWEMEDRDLSA